MAHQVDGYYKLMQLDKTADSPVCKLRPPSSPFSNISTVSLKAVNKAYKRASLRLHPDKGGNNADFQALHRAKKVSWMRRALFFGGFVFHEFSCHIALLLACSG